MQENDDDDEDDDEIDPRQLGWDERARRGWLDATTTNSGMRGRPNTRPKQLQTGGGDGNDDDECKHEWA
jgi:hypothetical protein